MCGSDAQKVQGEKGKYVVRNRWGGLARDFSRAQGGAQISAVRLISASLANPGIVAVSIYRLQERMHARGSRRLARFLRVVNNAVTGADMLPGSKIAPGLVLPHPTGVVIGHRVAIGLDCTILQNVTLGEKRILGEHTRLYPVLGDNVVVGAGAVVLGGVSIGNSSVVGANAVVMADVPDHSTAVGIPAVSRDRRPETSDATRDPEVTA